MLGRGHISHFSGYVLSSTLSIYSTLIAIVLRDYDAAFRYHSWFSLFYDGAVDIQIWALLTRSPCKVSDTQVTVKACGPLVNEKNIIFHGSDQYTFFTFLLTIFQLFVYFPDRWLLLTSFPVLIWTSTEFGAWLMRIMMSFPVLMWSS